jgi:hypothetical protein
MEATLNKVYKEAMSLSDELKAILSERIVEYLESNVDPPLERLHMETVKRRRDDIRQGYIQPVNGKDALTKVRRVLEK